VLKELNDNGNFRASLFATSTGLVLASQKAEDIDERKVAAMGSLLSDSAYKASEEMDLSDVLSMKIKYKQDFIIMRNITINENTEFLLAVLTKLPESEEIEKYIDQLLDWAEENSKGDLEKLSSLLFILTSLFIFHNNSRKIHLEILQKIEYSISNPIFKSPIEVICPFND
jgi:predicted regulator of Ras-like GTPase activity (Roadblock/LC7/MglB family)